MCGRCVLHLLNGAIVYVKKMGITVLYCVYSRQEEARNVLPIVVVWFLTREKKQYTLLVLCISHTEELMSE